MEFYGPTKMDFCPGRSTTSHILTLRIIVEELQNHKLEAPIICIDFKKAFDFIDCSKMFEILKAYGIPEEIVERIKIMYKDTSAIVSTPEGETDEFFINMGVLQGDPLSLLLFIICLDYAIWAVIEISDGLTLKKSKSSRYPAKVLSDLDFADDIAILENSLRETQNLINKIEKSYQKL